MARVMQLLLCVAAASELNSCDEKSSMLSLARNHSKCALSEEQVARTFEAGILSGKTWSHADAEVWLCERSHLRAPTQNGDPWADAAQAMSKIKWSKIAWPSSAKGGTSNFFYAGSILTGLTYTVAFAESIISGGDVKWGAFVQGIGTVLGSVLTEVSGLLGPILGAALTFALSLFGTGGSSISEQLEKALQKLYEKIMNEVKELMQQQQIENALRQGKDTMSNLMEVVIHIPTNIRSKCKANCTEDEIRQNTIEELLVVKRYMESHFAELFGSGVHCVENNQRVEKPPPECIQFLQQGALFFQFQAAMLHLNTLAQLASLIHDEEGRKNTAQELHEQAARYLPYLQWSLLGYLAGPEIHCSYDYQGDWDIRDTVDVSSAEYTGTTSWKGFNVPCQAGCTTQFVRMPGDSHRKDLCENGRVIYGSALCYWGNGVQHGNLRNLQFLHTTRTNQSFFPLLEAVENLTKPIPDALNMVKELVNNATPPAPTPVHNETFLNSTKFCGSLCDLDPFATSNCPDFCLKKIGNLTAPTTRCECSTTICPKVGFELKGFCPAACNIFPMFPDEAEAT